MSDVRTPYLWTPAREALLRKLWLAGNSYGAIRDQLPNRPTPTTLKTAVRRLGLPLRKAAVA